MKISVAGSGGFIGGHLVRDLLDEGHEVVAVDRKPATEWELVDMRAENHFGRDLSHSTACDMAVRGADIVYMLAADMGGMGFIENNKLLCMLSVEASTQMLKAADKAGVPRFFFSSSACVYPAGKQTDTDVTALKEEDAYPAMPEDGYGWEKLFTERMARHFHEDRGIAVRIARYHNVYGTNTAWSNGREKAPAAICRKVAVAKILGTNRIDIWGDGEQTRSFMFISDCIKGTKMIANGHYQEPLNLGSSELVSINQLVGLAEEIAGVKLERTYDLTAPQGVRGRNSDNTLIREVYGWEPSTPLADGLEKTYGWVHDQVAALLM